MVKTKDIFLNFYRHTNVNSKQKSVGLRDFDYDEEIHTIDR